MNSVQDAPAQAANTLVAHLRQHPEDASKNPQELASRLDLPPEFVEQVLEAIQTRSHGPATPKISLQFLLDWSIKALQLFDGLVQHPRRFIFATLIICVAVTTGLSYSGRWLDSQGVSFFPNLLFGTNVLLILLTGAAQMGCYFRKGMVRYALYGGLLLWITLCAVMLSELFQSPGDLSDRFRAAVLVCLGAGMLTLVYTGLGSAVSVFGAWVQLRRAEHREEHWSRQEMLERYFELQSRIRSGEFGNSKEPYWTQWAAVEAYEESPIFWSFFGGILLSLTTVLISGPVNVQPLAAASQRNVAVFLVLAVLGILTFAAFIAIGFFSRRPGRALANSIVFSAGGLLPFLLPLGQYGPQYFQSSTVVIQTVLNAAAMSLVAVFASMGAQVQERHWRESSIQQNDQATLTAEMLRIQWRLFGALQSVCVMVVDAARSSEMKANADPLAVEYSFREYQEWIETSCLIFGGRVHNTAGDGAVISFKGCREAFQAARRLQSDVARFNRDVNRLKHPFRLRIGLHTGEIAGDLEEVEFARVIDIAAHIQGVAPTSGVAVSEVVAAELPDEEFVQMAKEVDGFRVHLALNPVED